MSLRRKIAWLLAALAFVSAPCLALLQAADSEDELKSAAVWLFVRYSQLSPGPDGNINVGVQGRPAFVEALRRTLEGKSSGGHPVKVLEAKSDPRCCQVLYLATDKTEEIRRAMQSALPARPLTIGESDRFLEQGGAVNLFFVDGHIGFEASLEALDRCGVAISSNLLKFGQIRSRAKGSGAK